MWYNGVFHKLLSSSQVRDKFIDKIFQRERKGCILQIVCSFECMNIAEEREGREGGREGGREEDGWANRFRFDWLCRHKTGGRLCLQSTNSFATK